MLAEMIAAAARRLDEYRTRRELLLLPDEILRDIGLTRGDVRAMRRAPR